MRYLLLFTLLLLNLSPFSARASTPIPELLQPWVAWVLADEPQRLCPVMYNQSQDRLCAWPTQLNLDLTDSGGQFSQEWLLYSDSWVPLPGDVKHWPQAITVNGVPQPVSMKNGRPRVKLTAGRQLIRGQWQWDQLPNSLMLPPASALISLTVNEQLKPQPQLDAEGQLWLANDRQQAAQATPENALTLQVFRKVSDQIPLQLSSLLILEVAGEQRELVLGPVLLDKQIPLLIDSPLPAKIEPDGRLTLQVRPGRWTINIQSRQLGEVSALTLPKIPAPWPEQEIWVFEAEPQMRTVTVENLNAIDPQQTNLPSDWQQFPAYQVQAGESMELRELSRGNPEIQPNQLNLQRQLWLDFDGKGYSVQDSFTGRLNQGWRLEADPTLKLGQVRLNGQPQLITQQAGSDLEGIEIRQGQVQLSADSRYQGSTSSLPAVGWNTDVQSLHTQLNLPPGWRLFSASGVDQAEHTWIAQWTLLDLFLVLIASGAALRLWGWHWGVITLITLTLIWQENFGFGPPRWVWLNLLAASALLRVLAAGRLRKWLIGYHSLCLILLLLIALPFMADQVRVAIYPQLAIAHYYPPQPELEMTSDKTIMSDEVSMSAAGSMPDDMQTLKQSSVNAPVPAAPSALPQVDPNAKLQTGQGVPSWQWQSSQLSWHGPVSATEQLNLVLLSPTTNLLLSLLRVLLLSLLILRMAGFNISRKLGFYRTQPLYSALLPLLLTLTVAITWVMPTPAQAQIPDPALLNELKARVLAPPDCLPDCAQIAQLDLTLLEQSNTAHTLTAKLEVHAQAEVALPLPSAQDHWQLNKVLLNGEPATALRRDEKGILYLPLTEGVHQLELSGQLLSDQLQLELPLRPHRVQVRANGWSVLGLDENGVPNSQLQLSRLKKGEAMAQLSSSAIPDFVEVSRSLSLGLDWQVHTQVRRIAPQDQPISLNIPLLSGESVLTEGVSVKDGKVQLTLAADQNSASWQSRLEKTDQLTLTAAQTQQWKEIWRLDSSAIWHIEASGLPVIQQQDAQGNWRPEWQPWPGEALHLQISRPTGVAGQTLTIDSSQLAVTAGHSGLDVNLALHIRSSQGGQHRLQLPADISLQSVIINGQPQPPLLAADGSLLLPLTTNSQNVELNWRQQPGVSTWFNTPLIALNSPSVNNQLQLTLGEDRWILWTTGPLMGPAVLFWSLLVVITLFAFGLSRIPFTPLRFHAWLLLGIGLSQVSLWMALIVVAWLLALGLRGRWQHTGLGLRFNLAQIGLVLLSLLALCLLFLAVQQGLLGSPDMQISGNGSYGNMLRWYQDRSADLLPQAQVLSVPLWVYRGLMLGWALWLAFALLGWLRWGWRCFSFQGLWRPIHWRQKPASIINESKATEPKATGSTTNKANR